MRLKMNKILFFDYSNVIFRTINAAYVEGRHTPKTVNDWSDLGLNSLDEKYIPNDLSASEKKIMTTDEIHDFWKHITLNSILATIKREKPNRVIIGYDCRGGYWRHSLYPQYKSSRKESRSKSIVDFDLFFPVADKFKKDFIEAYPNFLHLEIDLCEADDIAGVICQRLHKDNEILLVTNDKDYIQLLRHPNVRLYNPVDKKEVVSLNPVKDLDLKVITGDKGDDIPAVKPRTGIKTAEVIFNKGIEKFIEEQADPQAVRDAYKRNRILIDMKYIPPVFQEKIISKYNEYPTKKFEFNHNMKFLHDNNLHKLVDDLMLNTATLLSAIK